MTTTKRRRRRRRAMMKRGRKRGKESWKWSKIAR